eukprot:SAG11_NODE_22050_length_413_cov_0.821656_1_plen_47_part_10
MLKGCSMDVLRVRCRRIQQVALFILVAISHENLLVAHDPHTNRVTSY